MARLVPLLITPEWMEMLRAHTVAWERRSKSLRRHFLIRKVSFLQISIFIIIINHPFPCPTRAQLSRIRVHQPPLPGWDGSTPPRSQRLPGEPPSREHPPAPVSLRGSQEGPCQSDTCCHHCHRGLLRRLVPSLHRLHCEREV